MSLLSALRGEIVKNADAIFEITLVSPLFICRLYIFFHQMIDTQRNAESVFPEPVGATISVLFPAAIDGHPSRWGGLGSRTFCEP